MSFLPNRPKPKNSRGIYPGSGVARGGQTARSAQVFKGLVGPQGKGGLNTQGSKPSPFGRTLSKVNAPPQFRETPSGSVVPAIPPRPKVTALDANTRARQQAAQQVWDRKYGHLPNAAAAGRSSSPSASLSGSISGGGPKAPVGIAKPPASAQAIAPGPIDIRAQSAYQEIMNAALRSKEDARIAADQQTTLNKDYFRVGSEDLLKNTARDTYDTNAAMAARGVYQSGGRVQADTDRAENAKRARLSLIEQFGGESGRSNAIIQALAAADQGYRDAETDALEAGQFQYDEQNPALPIWAQTLLAGQKGGPAAANPQPGTVGYANWKAEQARKQDAARAAAAKKAKPKPNVWFDNKPGNEPKKPKGKGKK